MIKPARLKKGDKIAIVSLSWGGLGDEAFIHKYPIAKQRLENDFGLQVVTMPHALKGSGFVATHPELRAKDLMDAFEDTSISAIFCAIGGDDTIRTLPFINFETIRNNPKIFMGYSDSTINHFMMYKAGLVSFYGPSVMCEFGEYVKMFDYTVSAVKDVLFGEWAHYLLASSPEWTDDYVLWNENNVNIPHKLKKDTHGYEIINGRGTVKGHLLGGCIDVFMMAIGTKIWPSINEWTNAILFIETSEDKPSPDFIKWTFRNLAAQGILNVLKGIIVGKPQGEKYYEAYKTAITQVVYTEEHLHELPIIYNVNFGHAKPIGILPYGIMVELNCADKTIVFLESATLEVL
ncbi:S66 peptidase family protein [Fusibacter sp. 3D3]|uniref:S66 family peptidase n=1 Tax=Fusibacter sp. 3D3 TaxID=1048380 RepID=UPI0008537CAB|nr:S66 peptidase family protein [Fusibacter sp. 3D3]GAU78495.1 muramoyltetrapeptide carboxypeptidase [Fusibacter sp. 3D3]